MKFKQQIATIMGAAALITATLTAPAVAADHIVIGASGGHSTLQSRVGTQIARHVYGRLSGSVHVAEFVNIESSMDWSVVANGGQDANIRRWANGLKGRGAIMVSFSHEPMAKQNIHMGNAGSFIAAWKHVVSVFNQQGATNVRWVWNATSHSFRISSGSSAYGAKWYPGDSWVDFVAGEAFNRYQCGFSSPRSFAEQIKELLAFANQHNKKLVVAEFASNSYPGRADWVKTAHAFMDARKSQFAGAFYYQSRTHADGCNWQLSTSAEFSALRALVTDSGFGA